MRTNDRLQDSSSVDFSLGTIRAYSALEIAFTHLRYDIRCPNYHASNSYQLVNIYRTEGIQSNLAGLQKRLVVKHALTFRIQVSHSFRLFCIKWSHLDRLRKVNVGEKFLKQFIHSNVHDGNNFLRITDQLLVKF